MSSKRLQLISRIADLPEEYLEEVEDAVHQIVEWHSGKPYRPSPEELQAIDEGDTSGVATDEEVEAAFAKFRRA